MGFADRLPESQFLRRRDCIVVVAPRMENSLRAQQTVNPAKALSADAERRSVRSRPMPICVATPAVQRT